MDPNTHLNGHHSDILADAEYRRDVNYLNDSVTNGDYHRGRQDALEEMERQKQTVATADQPLYRNPVGRPANPKIDSTFAKTEMEILSDFPFHGILMRLSDDRPIYMKAIPRYNPAQLSKIAKTDLRQGGEYLLRTTDEEGAEIEICFTIDSPENGKKSKDASPSLSALDAETLRTRIKEEIRGDYDHRLQLLQADVQSHMQRNNELAQRNADLTQRLADEKVTLIQQHSNEISNLRSELSAVKQELAIAQLKNELNGINDDEDADDETPAWMNSLNKFMPLIEKVMANANAPQPVSDAHVSDAVEVRTNQQQKPSPDQIMQQAFQNFANTIIENAVSAMVAKASPDSSAIAEMVGKQLTILAQQGVQPGAREWMMIAEQVATQAIERKVTPQRVALVIEPLIANLNQAKTVLKYMPAKEATNMLFSTFQINPPDPVRALIVNVLEVFKQKI
ncbi:MAG: hypothetical protein LAT57_00165 [Balneolales bacterium]|nr:hypothetical protein [Balneolales bacterium]